MHYTIFRPMGVSTQAESSDAIVVEPHDNCVTWLHHELRGTLGERSE